MDDAASPPSPVKHKVDALQELVSRRLSSSAARLSAASRSIPSEKDFHFYNNFPEFRRPSSSIAARSEAFLRSLASAELWGEKPGPGLPDDLDDYYDWLVNVNDDILERFSVSMDEFKKLREKQEEGGSSMLEDGQDGFQLVYGKKKRVTGGLRGGGGAEKDESYVASGVKVASRDQQTMAAKPKVPFHMPMITRPQIQFNIIVNNSNKPFEHVWLEKSEDGTRFIHPLEKLSAMDFVDRNVGEGDPVKPLPLKDTLFKLVEDVSELKELCAKLQDANEFAVDLEHNHYRSFQGLTCLMQISTREEDFIIDTLKLRIHVGPYLREVFKNPSKRKVMHGADSDMMWLQRDFGIYVCNLFDTGQASRVLQLERKSLEYLLRHFCEVKANKEYQTADWRLRPLPDDMIKYAREDTHYLLYIYDLMKRELLKNSTDEKDLLAEVYERSYEICRQLYEKELFMDTSYLYIYGLKEADFNSSQLAIVAALFQWRDSVARAEDESTGYVLPNRLLLEIARQMPVSSNKLRRLMRSKHPIVARHFDSLISIMRNAIQNSAAFEGVSEQLKQARLEYLEAHKLEANGDNSVPIEAEDHMDVTTAQADALNSANDASVMQCDEEQAVGSTDVKDDQVDDSFHSIPLPETECIIGQSEIATKADREKLDGHKTEAKPTAAQISRKSSSALSSMFRATSSKRKVMIDSVATAEQDKNVNKVDRIEASFVPPLHSFSGPENNTRQSHPEIENNTRQAHPEYIQQHDSQPFPFTLDVIPLENETGQMAENDLKHREWFPRLPENGSSADSQPETRTEEAPMSLSELSSSFQECFKSLNEMKGGAKQNQRTASQQQVQLNLQLRPFDYADARQHIRFGEGGSAGGDDAQGSQDSRRSKKGAARGGGAAATAREAAASEFQQPRRRQAFPPSGNRNGTFR